MPDNRPNISVGAEHTGPWHWVRTPSPSSQSNTELHTEFDRSGASTSPQTDRQASSQLFKNYLGLP